MQVNRGEFIREYFSIVWHHPEAVESDWTIFCLEEDHYNEEGKKINGLFMSLFSPPGSVLAVESENYLQTTKVPETTKKDFYITTSNIKSENIIGWDMKDFSLFIDSKKNANFIAIKILHALENNFILNLNNFNWKSTMLSCWNNLQQQMSKEQQQNLDLIYTTEAIHHVALEMSTFSKKKLIPLEKSCRKEKKLAEKLKGEIALIDPSFAGTLESWFESKTSSDGEAAHKFDSETLITFLMRHKEGEVLLDQYLEAVKKYSESKTKRCLLVNKKIRKMIKRLNETSKFFPIRTHAMITTLQNADDYITADQSVFHLVAGGKHLEEDTNEVNEKYSLDAFYNFIKTRKNVVILRAKVLQ